jgi:hypothetical protein
MSPHFVAANRSTVCPRRLALERATFKAFGRMGTARAIFIASCVLSMPAHATLGQGVSTVASDSTWMRAIAHTVTQQSGYAVHRITLPSGTVVREYVSPGGIVFGVAWEGPTLPDLKSILGAAFDQYVAATATRRASPVAVSTSNLVVFSGGHLRAFAGHAWLPLAVPDGVDIGVIQ